MLIPCALWNGPAISRAHTHPDPVYAKLGVMIIDRLDGDDDKPYDWHGVSRCIPLKVEPFEKGGPLGGGTVIDGVTHLTLYFPVWSKADEKANRITPDLIARWYERARPETIREAMNRCMLQGYYADTPNLGAARHQGMTKEVEDFLAGRKKVLDMQQAQRVEAEQKRKAEALMVRAKAEAQAGEDFLAGKEIAPSYFESLSKMLKITVPIQTIGSFRKRVASVGINACGVYGKGFLAPGIYSWIRSVHEALKEKYHPTPTDPAVERLFQPGGTTAEPATAPEPTPTPT